MKLLELLWSQLWIVGVAFIVSFLITLAVILVIQLSRQDPAKSRQDLSTLRSQRSPEASTLPSVDIENLRAGETPVNLKDLGPG